MKKKTEKRIFPWHLRFGVTFAGGRVYRRMSGVGEKNRKKSKRKKKKGDVLKVNTPLRGAKRSPRGVELRKGGGCG